MKLETEDLEFKLMMLLAGHQIQDGECTCGATLRNSVHVAKHLAGAVSAWLVGETKAESIEAAAGPDE